jgi:hypothetical protein
MGELFIRALNIVGFSCFRVRRGIHWRSLFRPMTPRDLLSAKQALLEAFSSLRYSFVKRRGWSVDLDQSLLEARP